MTVQDAATEVRNDTTAALESVGIQIEYHHHEVARRSTRSTCATTTHCDTDKTMTYRIVVRRCRLARVLRDLHAEAAVRRERLGHAHAHVALHRGRNQFFDGS
jgi:glutamine synthetase